MATLRERRLAAALRLLRASSGMTLETVSEVLEGDLAANTISQIEKCKRPVTSATLRMLLEAYRVTGDERAALRELADQARERSWWQQYPAEILPRWAQEYVGLEAEAAAVRVWDLGLMHGLLQTEDYCRAILSAAPAAGNAEIIERKIRLRMQRQERLASAAPPDLRFIMDESVIRRTVGSPAAMRAQLLHVAGLAERGHVTVRVVRFSAGAHQGQDGSFSILAFADDLDPDVAYFEYQTGSFSLEEAADVVRYQDTFNRLEGLALEPGDSVALIRDAAAQLA